MLICAVHFLTLNFLSPGWKGAQRPSSLISVTPSLPPRLGGRRCRGGRSHIPHSQTIALLQREALRVFCYSASPPFVPRSPPWLRVPSTDPGGAAASPSPERVRDRGWWPRSGSVPGVQAQGCAAAERPDFIFGISGAAPRAAPWLPPSHHPPPDVSMHQGAVPGLMFSGGI